MNNQEEVGTGENPYVPSARKSIHNHDRNIFGTCSDMGRYGLASKRELNPASSPSNLDQGTDEVDNVMSKFDRQSSPIPVRQKKSLRKDRRNSLNISDPEFSDDDESDSNLLAKSLPANLPSYYCSNDLSHKSGDFLQAHNTNSFSDSRKTLKTTSNEYNYGYNSTSTSFEESFKNHEDKQVQKSCVQIICPLFVAVLSIIAAMYYYGLLNQETSSNYDKSKFNKDMSDLGEKYKINEDSILEVQSGISTILEKNDTGSFIFIYNGQSMNFDHFVQEIASTAARYLRNDSIHSQPQPTVLHSSDLDMNSHSDLMKQYEYKVAKSGVMVVKDVDRIPSSLAMAFHYFCDEFSPLVAKSAIFFTLNLDNCSEYAASAQKFRHKHVEKCLANIWKMMPKENIQPLLARIVNVVIDVTDVF